MKHLNIIGTGIYILLTINSWTSGINEPKEVCIFDESLADCSDNELDRIPRHFSKPFERLDLSHNNIRSVESYAFTNAQNLTYLSLSFNNIDSIASDGFYGLPLLNQLDISNNRLQQIAHSVFFNLRSLQSLELQYNNFGIRKAELAKNVTTALSIRSLSIDVGQGFHFPFEFSYLTNITYLYLFIKDSDWKMLYYRDTFRHLGPLKISSLTLFGVTQIMNDTFYYLNSLKTLTMYIDSNARISPVNDIFSSLSSFEGQNMSTIKISLNRYIFAFTLGKNHLKYFEKICLERFILQDMYIKYVDNDVFEELPRYFPCLEYMEISGNIIYSQDGLLFIFFSLFKKLKVFKMQNNARHDEPVPHKTELKSEWKIYLPLTLEELYIVKDIQINTLPNITFVHGTNLRVLSLPDNRIGDCLGSFKGIENITLFDISGWQCALLSENIVSFFPKLETFVASRAQIGIGFKNNSKTSTLFRNNPLLKTVDLSYNEISLLPNGLFLWHFLQLSLVNLSHNYVTLFPKFQNKIKSLQMVDLTFNRITTFTNEDIQMIEKLGPFKILLSNNPLQCSCKTLTFLKWIKQSQQIADISLVSCYLNDGRHVHLSDINMKLFEISCVTKFWLTFSAVMVSVLILSILITVVYVRYKYAIQYMLLRAKLWWKGTPNHDRNYTYNAFISCCHSDLAWVKQLYNKMSETGLTFCVSAKDFLPGVEIAENILQAIDSSRNVIFIISRDFLKSEWCSFELEMTRMHAFQRERDDMMIVVLKENVKIEEMPKVLRSIWWKVTCIEWPEDDNVQPFNTQDIFYKSLTLALQPKGKKLRPNNDIELD